ncbi:MAG: FAD-binding oxidoreductase [Thermoleophilia bacterium]
MAGRAFIRKLKQIVGAEHVSTAAEDLICYGYDGTTASGKPEAVVRPVSTAEIAAVMKLVGDEGGKVVPRGAGTGLSGGSVPAEGGIVLHFSRMNRLTRLDAAEMIAIAEPGITNWDFRKAVATAGLFYPPDPSSTRVCTLGGNVAENAGGPSGIKYGVTGDYVIGLEAVTASGDIFRTGGETRRNAAGYDLTGMLVGSEGTLAIVTEITVKLLARPAALGTAVLAFDDLAVAGSAVATLCALATTPAAIDIMDAVTIACVERYRPGYLPDGAAAVLLVEVDGEENSVAGQLRQVGEAASANGGRIIRSTTDIDESEELWESRRSISAALARMAPTRIGEDICVPRTSIPEALERLRRVGEENDLTIAVFGHAGDGVLHPNILTDDLDPEMMARTEKAIAGIFQAALDIGGTLSGEHGIGMAKSRFMRGALSDETISLMKGIKLAFDPKGILNPGKIF